MKVFFEILKYFSPGGFGGSQFGFGGAGGTGGGGGGSTLPITSSLVDGATIPVDASLVDPHAVGTYLLTLAASGHTISNPTNPTDGQKIRFKIKQGGSGTNLVVWDTKYLFTLANPSPILSTAAAAVDWIDFQYDAAEAGGAGAWICQGVSTGYNQTA